MDFLTMDFLSWDNAIALLTLTSLEIVLGIDNVIFIAILAGKLPPADRDRARQLGLGAAVISRIALLLAIGWVLQLAKPLFSLGEHAVTGKDVVLILGGLFLIAKATYEIHHKVQHVESPEKKNAAPATLSMMLAQVLLIDIVFSLDSVITAVGMTKQVPIMIAAVIISIAVMLIFSGAIVRFVDQHPAIKILALSFLLMIGGLLVAEGLGAHLDKGYVYFAMAFSLGIELLQMRMEHNHHKRNSVALHDPAD